MFKEGQKLLSNLQEIVVNRNTPETILSKIEFDIAVEERLPLPKPCMMIYKVCWTA